MAKPLAAIVLDRSKFMQQSSYRATQETCISNNKALELAVSDKKIFVSLPIKLNMENGHIPGNHIFWMYQNTFSNFSFLLPTKASEKVLLNLAQWFKRSSHKA